MRQLFIYAEVKRLLILIRCKWIIYSVMGWKWFDLDVLISISKRRLGAVIKKVNAELVVVEMLCVKEVFVAKGRNNASLYFLLVGHYPLTIDLALPYHANKYYLRTAVAIAHKNPQKLLYVLKTIIDTLFSFIETLTMRSSLTKISYSTVSVSFSLFWLTVTS